MRAVLRRVPTRLVGPLVCLGALGLAGLGLAGGTGCTPDLGDPVLRYADWDATAPDGDGGGTNSNTMLAEWLPDCGPDYYPCPPYGNRRNDVLAEFRMTAANDEALAFADAQGILTLGDFHRTEKKLLFVFQTAGW